ncbi:twin-arginine translocase TatA/TatE family subunit [bacterium]|nr:twin-arginine translocase TatA/TatE family subunit [candidate division CSSED10-310 bacterium]
MFGLGIWEIVLILLIVMIIFGVGKLPEIGTGLGQGIKNFKKSFREESQSDAVDKGPEKPALKENSNSD